MRRVLAVVLFCIAVAVSACCQAVTTLTDFSGSNIIFPNSPLIQGMDGNFYGTSEQGGGTENAGTVFKVTPAGTVSTLYSFCVQGGACQDGSYPQVGLVQASDGNFYGVTYSGGDLSCGCGTVFKITPAGAFTTLHTFRNGDGKSPTGPLIQAKDGNLYGTTLNGGTHGVGTIFKITLGGSLTTIFYFGGQDGDGDPYSGVIQGTDGNFYGTTEWGGTEGVGSVFKVTPGGMYTMLHSFNGTDGAWVTAGLVQASDGNFYGATKEGGPNGNGTLFKITPNGTFTTLHTFADYTFGRYPNGSLVQGTDGNLYGVTISGGFYQDGTLFKTTIEGDLTSLHQFNATKGEGLWPGTLVHAKDGNFYGTTYHGGAGYGTVVRLSVPSASRTSRRPSMTTATTSMARLPAQTV